MHTATQRDYRERIIRVLVYIQQHLDDELTLAELADIACFSAFHFHRVFRGMVGEPLGEHIRRIRLERAASRLRFGPQPVLQIALDAGYETHESFTRAFRALFGESPSEFRESHKLPAAAHAMSRVHFAQEPAVGDFEPINTGGATMEARIEKLPTMKVCFVRNVGPYADAGKAWEKLCSWAGQSGLVGPHTQFIGISHDDPEVTPAAKLRYDACMTVDRPVQPVGEVGCQEVIEGEYATTRHVGPYERLVETYGRLCGEWLPAHGREPASGPCIEFYRNDPKSTPPQQLITDVYVPVNAARRA